MEQLLEAVFVQVSVKIPCSWHLWSFCGSEGLSWVWILLMYPARWVLAALRSRDTWSVRGLFWEAVVHPVQSCLSLCHAAPGLSKEAIQGLIQSMITPPKSSQEMVLMFCVLHCFLWILGSSQSNINKNCFSNSCLQTEDLTHGCETARDNFARVAYSLGLCKIISSGNYILITYIPLQFELHVVWFCTSCPKLLNVCYTMEKF